MFLCCSIKTQLKPDNNFETQFTFDKWLRESLRLIESCSFLTTSWDFLLLHVRWLTNCQFYLLPLASAIFYFFCFRTVTFWTTIFKIFSDNLIKLQISCKFQYNIFINRMHFLLLPGMREFSSRKTFPLLVIIVLELTDVI